jgi:hypothetical protein
MEVLLLYDYKSNTRSSKFNGFCIFYDLCFKMDALRWNHLNGFIFLILAVFKLYIY